MSSSDRHTVTQDQKDIIRQEYLNHNLTVSTRNALQPPMATANFSEAEVRQFTVYSVILGQPAMLAQAVRDQYNRLIPDDVQQVAVGTTGLAASAIVVSPGTSIQTIGPILDTDPCNGAPNPQTCDDRVSGNNILAGPNGIATPYWARTISRKLKDIHGY